VLEVSLMVLVDIRWFKVPRNKMNSRVGVKRLCETTLNNRAFEKMQTSLIGIRSHGNVE
jgi:hypothetical protein